VDGIVVSHGHPDHMADLAAFSVLRRYGPTMDQGLARTPLLGPRGIDQRILAVSGAETDDYTDLSVFDFTAVQQFARISLGPFDISVAKAWHPVPAVGYRIEGPGEAGGRATLVYTGDTDRCAEQDALATGADVLLAEAGWAHREVNPEGVHMNGTQAGAMAAEAGVGRLVLTHVASWVNPAPTLAQAKQAFAATQLATPGLVVRL
jgi:ribonuclease BN (tRNA processing enzyme)